MNNSHEILTLIRCPCGAEAYEDCGEIMTKEYDGLCRECYESAMDAAYSDISDKL